MSKDTSSFSVSAAKALFEAAKKPEFQKAAVAAAKNPFVRQTAKNVAQDEKARGAVLNAVKDPSGGNKISAAFAVADANRKTDAPALPPHRATGSSYSEQKTVPGKLSSNHSAIRSQLENLHLGGSSSSTSTSFTPAATSSSSLQSSYTPSYQHSSTAAPPPPPPVPRHNGSAVSSHSPSYSAPAISTPHGIALFEYAPTQSDEMALRVGDTVLLSKTVDPLWVYGENQNTRTYGIVPISYLDIKIPLKQAFVAPAPPPPLPVSAGSGGLATALYDYYSNESGDLSFVAGDQITIISRLDADWMEGELYGRRGMFPAQFVDSSGASNAPMKQQSHVSSLPQTSVPKSTGPAKTVEVKYTYESGVDTDLRAYEGDIVTVIDDIDSEWLYGECRGKQGMIPKNFLGPPYGSPKKKSAGIAEIANAFTPKKAVATADFHTQDPNNLYASRGDRLLIVEDVDEYYYKAKPEMFKTIAAGNIPKNMVELTN